MAQLVCDPISFHQNHTIYVMLLDICLISIHFVGSCKLYLLHNNHIEITIKIVYVLSLSLYRIQCLEIGFNLVSDNARLGHGVGSGDVGISTRMAQLVK